MQKIGYYIAYPFLWMVSLLPFWVMYLLSDFIAFLIYHVVGYRKQMVRNHLQMALPHLSEKERLKIEKESYRHFSDNFLELNKALTASEKTMISRFRVLNPEVAQELGKKHKNIIIMYSHHASYEWTTVMHHYTKIKSYIVYKKLNNPYFDEMVNNIRTRFGAHLVLTSDTFKLIKKSYKDDFPKSFGFVSDQSPMLGQERHWLSFFGKEVPIFTGAEDIGKRTNMAVVYMNVQKVKRGFYEATFDVMTEDIQSIPNYELMEDYYKRVENQILQSPAHYLWTHNRWKHAGKNKG